MRRNWSKVAITLGPVIVMVTIVWETARTNPAYGFLVEPWSLRGDEMDQRWASFAVGLALLLLSPAVAPKRSVEIGSSAAVVGLGTIAGTALALVFGPDVVSITFSSLIVAVLSLLPAVTVHRTFTSLALPSFPALNACRSGSSPDSVCWHSSARLCGLCSVPQWWNSTRTSQHCSA